MGTRHAILTDRINAEPPILRGCLSSELALLLVGGGAFWVPMALIVGTLTEAGFAALGIAAVCIVGTVYGAGRPGCRRSSAGARTATTSSAC